MKQKDMRVAIMMLTFNRVRYLDKTIKKYEVQLAGDNRFKFFVLDNASTDGTQEYLENYQGSLDLEVIRMSENLGVAGGTKYLLKHKCFDKGFDFIVRADDDEILADSWPEVFSFWDRFEEHGGVVVGFRRKGLNDYFEGFKWIARNSGFSTPLKIEGLVCYKSDIVPGFQISKECWWKACFSSLSDYGRLYGGWDYTLMEALIVQKKSCLVVWNLESEHFQDHNEYEDLEALKQKELNGVMLEIKRNNELKKQVFIDELREIKANPTKENLMLLKEMRASLQVWAPKG